MCSNTQCYLTCYYSAASSQRRAGHGYRCAGNGLLLWGAMKGGRTFKALQGLCSTLPSHGNVTACALVRRG